MHSLPATSTTHGVGTEVTASRVGAVLAADDGAHRHPLIADAVAHGMVITCSCELIPPGVAAT